MATVALDTIRVLLVEDDDGDALIVEDLLDSGPLSIALHRCGSLHDALDGLRPEIDCVLLDLGLPDIVGIDTVARVREAAPGIAVIVLTGLDNEAAGVAAVSAGAQDYLVKGQVDAALLARAIRYAIERGQAEEARQRLRIAELQTAENARLERGLVPRPIVTHEAIWLASSYQPGRRRALLGGDFFDVVETADGSLHALVGDVCGHGPDEAALGASLRIAWRALTLSGTGTAEVLRTVQDVLEHEQQIPGTFATLCTLEIAPDHRSMKLRRAGHPPPLLIDGAQVTMLPTTGGGPPLGVGDRTDWTASSFELPSGWSILLYTDGLVDGRVGTRMERLGEDGLRNLTAEHVEHNRDWHAEPEALLGNLVERATELNGADLTDDVAMLLVGSRDGARGSG